MIFCAPLPRVVQVADRNLRTTGDEGAAAEVHGRPVARPCAGVRVKRAAGEPGEPPAVVSHDADRP